MYEERERMIWKKGGEGWMVEEDERREGRFIN